MRKKKGFTLIELLVVIAIIAMLLAILMPALGKVKKLAMRLVCGTNTKGLGTAMNVYAFDYDDEFPVQGGAGADTWADTLGGGLANSQKDWTIANQVTIGSCLYMLVREADVSPKSFVCPASDDQEFKLSDDPFIVANSLTATTELTDLWDFGMYPAGGWDGTGAVSGQDDSLSHYSYSYQQVFTIGTHTPYRPDASGNAAKVILADKSPYCDRNLINGDTTTITDSWAEYVSRMIAFDASSSDPQVKIGNSGLHDREGQNVLYNDGHSEFAKRPDVSFNNDNIYTRKGGDTEWGRRVGQYVNTIDQQGYANGSQDTILVSDSRCKQSP